MTTDAQLQEAIANCSRDPIHIPGTIQSFGALIATDNKMQSVEFASQNTKELLGIDARALLSLNIEDILGRQFAHQARNCLSLNTISEQRRSLGVKVFASNRLQVSVHLKDQRAILEFIPVDSPNNDENTEQGFELGNALDATRLLMAEAIGQEDYQVVLDAAVENLRSSTGFDRVMAYRFLPDGSGQVVAESRSAHSDSFLGLRFPASDIPPVARRLYAQTPIRVIADVEAVDLPILSAADSARPLDLSLALLRGTADVHVRYLKNMKVRSTMTLPIVVDGKMWGLFSLHHAEPKACDPATLIGAELSGKMLSLVIEHMMRSRHQSHLHGCTGIASSLIDFHESMPGAYWDEHRDALINAIPSDGMCYIVADKVQIGGSAPSFETCQTIRDLATADENELVVFDDLPMRLNAGSLGNTAGALVICLSEHLNISLILFRDLASRTIHWAGEPVKTVTAGADGMELNPRNSFAIYKESISNKADEWTNDEMEVAAVLRNALLSALEHQTSKQATQDRLKLMVQELNHRVRNILTLVQSLSSTAKVSAESIEGYATALEQRIVALAGAHDLLTKEDMQGARLDKIAGLELRPYLEQNSISAVLTGPQVILNPDVSPIIALVLHELTSNAVKYGALSRTGGQVTLNWALEAKGLSIEWIESGGPAVTEPAYAGFGRSIIENSIPYEFNGSAEIQFLPQGVFARFFLPEDTFKAMMSTVQLAAINRAQDPAQSAKQPTLQKALLVEDSYIIALEAKRWLKEIGFSETVAVSTVSQALQRLEHDEFDFCLLDINLRGVMSEPVARKLVELGTPFVFASGYGSSGNELCSQFDVPFLTKPISVEELRAIVRTLKLA